MAQPDQPGNPVHLSHAWNLDLEQEWSLELAQINDEELLTKQKKPENRDAGIARTPVFGNPFNSFFVKR